jgi:hypothetical protein
VLRYAGVLAAVGTLGGGGRPEIPQHARHRRALVVAVANLQRVEVDTVAGNDDEVTELARALDDTG